MEISKIIYIYIIIFYISIGYSQSFTHRLRVPIDFIIESGLGYDSNFLKLSNSEIDELVLNNSIIGSANSYDSIISNNLLSIKYSPHFIQNHQTKFQIKIRSLSYFTSSEKSYFSFGISISQHIDKYEWLKLSYSFIPNYYLRNYRDRDKVVINTDINDLLIGCSFSQGSSIISYSKWIGNRSYIEGLFNYQTQYYNVFFSEFDLDIISFGISLISKDNKKIPIKLNYKQTFAQNISLNKGLRTSFEIDRGYKQDSFYIQIQRLKVNKLVNNIGLRYSLSSRKYSSDYESDILHFKRNHSEKKLKIWFSSKLNSNLFLQFDITSRSRITSSAYSWVEELKKFNKKSYFLRLKYSFSSELLY